MAQQSDAYPLEKILDAAELVGMGEGSMPKQIERLKDTDVAVRYWAVIGLHAQGQQARPAVSALKTALDDPAPAVRIEAAWALADLGETGKPLDLLAKELDSSDKRVALRAARALQMLGPKSKPALPAMRKALSAAKKGRGDGNMFIKFSLEPAVEALRKK